MGNAPFGAHAGSQVIRACISKVPACKGGLNRDWQEEKREHLQAQIKVTRRAKAPDLSHSPLASDQIGQYDLVTGGPEVDPTKLGLCEESRQASEDQA